jgi:hypothetical protein
VTTGGVRVLFTGPSLGPPWACVSMCVLGPCAPVQVRVWVGTPLAPPLLCAGPRESPLVLLCAGSRGPSSPIYVYLYTSIHASNSSPLTVWTKAFCFTRHSCSNDDAKYETMIYKIDFPHLISLAISY